MYNRLCGGREEGGRERGWKLNHENHDYCQRGHPTIHTLVPGRDRLEHEPEKWSVQAKPLSKGRRALHFICGKCTPSVYLFIFAGGGGGM